MNQADVNRVKAVDRTLEIIKTSDARHRDRKDNVQLIAAIYQDIRQEQRDA